MCGIVGVVGNQEAAAILVQGLEKLEYRGYDSAGIFLVTDKQETIMRKAKGRIADLKEKLSASDAGEVGIGHTRWATHGEPSEANAHPHVSKSGRFALVHNGVIENFEELRKEYLSDAVFHGETDTEIVVELIDVFAARTGDGLAAFEAALAVIKGSYAFALIDMEQPDRLLLAKNKSPLLIGLGDGFHVTCSDAMAVLSQTRRFVEIADGERVVLTKDAVTITDADGNQVDREPFEAQIDATDIEKGVYDHYMLKEIDEQPAVMRKLINAYTAISGDTRIDEQLLERILASDRLYIVACGTSWHAGLVGKEIIETLAEIPVEVHLSSEFGYHMPILSEKPYFIFLSQSGETADSRQVLVTVNKKGYDSLTITNVNGSTLSREATDTLLLHAGPEIAVASTKAYTSQIAVMTFLARALGVKKGIQAACRFDVAYEMGLVANGMDQLISEKHEYDRYSREYFLNHAHAFYIGRGLDYAVALEGALKLKEISYIHAEGFAAGELKHGTIALIEEGTPVLGLITNQATAAHTRGNLMEVTSRGARTIVVAAEELASEGDDIVLPSVHPLLRSLVSVVPLQLLAYYASLQRGLDVDKPRNLAKSVTVE